MDATTLRAAQAPLKESYRADPAAAVITLHADGSLSEGISCSVDTGRALVAAGLHPSTGGDGSLACSGDLLLQALVACAGVTVRAVATALELPITGGTVRAEGDLDVRGTLGVDREAPVGFRQVRLTFDVEGNLSDEQRDRLLTLTERYCVVLQSLTQPTPVESTLTAG